ncbi:tRNA pseudouridine(38-40) synthase TruA [Salinibacterium sp. SYSU T00001]|uniref:tRNA pseudouridine(38-40) synthase TruA n=1 Tax=Homoserinimonas sedimenticola TaxID=2986805 RepID=UPI002235EDE2|nr:tRNA pseudouridine(38-40) synthase TruA [Salinibacterium sedimenticola]MCW4385290.1 tRNA pseudouridine(38-40) synthase TruA [Salinibacterium sedimenticola]
MDSQTAAPPPAASGTRIRLDIAYDGTAFSGWARQRGLRTVQGEIEGALAVLLRRHPPAPRLIVAGRTDAGVHATGQVAHLDLTEEQAAALSRHRQGSKKPVQGAEALARRINGILGLDSDIVIRRSSLAAEGFDARFSPVWRRYEYRVGDASVARNPLVRHNTVWYPAALDEARMNDAAAELLGLHDFAAYCRPPQAGATTVRTLQEFSWRRDPDGVLIATVQADAFCHSMVRSLVGACVSAGQGALSVERVGGILAERARVSEFKVMPAKGLTLLEVGYPADEELAARAEQTRARREPLD